MWLLILLLVGLAFGVTEKEFREDKNYVEKVSKRLDTLDEKLQKEGAKRKLLEELNSYGYPLYRLRDKYIHEPGSRYKEFLLEINTTYDKLLFVKRGIFPALLKREFSQLKLPVCKVSVSGPRRESLSISLKNPKDEKTVLRMMTETQLQFAHLIGIEEIKFSKCP